MTSTNLFALFYLISSLCVAVDASLFNNGPSAEEIESKAAPEIHCMNPGYNVDEYLSKFKTEQTKIGSFLNGIDVWGTSKLHSLDPFMKSPVADMAQFVSGAGHTWAKLHPNSRNCLDSPRSLDGCEPFSDLIQEFRLLEECLAPITELDGTYLGRKDIISEFNFNGISPSRTIITRLAMLAEENPNGIDWNDEEVESIISKEQRLQRKDTSKSLEECIKDSNLTRQRISCWPTLLGATGFFSLSIFDHVNRPHQDGLDVKKTCKVHPVCGRLAAEKLHHLSNLKFEPNFLKGWKGVPQLDEAKEWVTLSNGKQMHRSCQLHPDFIKPQVCWFYTECFAQMLKLVCQEHPGCCPSPKVHDACVENVASRRCNKVCKRKTAFFRLW